MRFLTRPCSFVVVRGDIQVYRMIHLDRARDPTRNLAVAIHSRGDLDADGWHTTNASGARRTSNTAPWSRRRALQTAGPRASADIVSNRGDVSTRAGADPQSVGNTRRR